MMFHWTGSTIPLALCWAVPSALAAVCLRLLLEHFEWDRPDVSGYATFYSSYTAALAFLLVFRTQSAYSRWWNGGELLLQVQGSWFTAFSGLLAFCSSETEKSAEVEEFQHLLIRLFSLLHCAALQQIAVMEDEDFQIIGTDGISEAALVHLESSNHRCEILMQWIQKLVVNQIEGGVLSIAPPILSRTFQELGKGLVDYQNARKINEFQFPLPFAQMISILLMGTTMVTPFLACFLVENTVFVGIVSFIVPLVFWGVNLIAIELEMPFGDDANDLPMHEMQINFNDMLKSLFGDQARHPPVFTFDAAHHTHFRRDRQRRVSLSKDAPPARQEKPAFSKSKSKLQLYKVVDAARRNTLSKATSRKITPDADDANSRIEHKSHGETPAHDLPAPHGPFALDLCSTHLPAPQIHGESAPRVNSAARDSSSPQAWDLFLPNAPHTEASDNTARENHAVAAQALQSTRNTLELSMSIRAIPDGDDPVLRDADTISTEAL